MSKWARREQERRGPRLGKTVVFGLLERGEGKGKSRVRAMIVPTNRSARCCRACSRSRAGRDGLQRRAHVVRSLPSWGFQHEVINHAVRVRRGRVHTNSIENFWSCLKRTLGGTYIAARAFHLDAYLDEQMFRFNEREDNDGGRFVTALKGADGRRLTYAALTNAHPRWRERPGREGRRPSPQARRAADQRG